MTPARLAEIRRFVDENPLHATVLRELVDAVDRLQARLSKATGELGNLRDAIEDAGLGELDIHDTHEEWAGLR